MAVATLPLAPEAHEAEEIAALSPVPRHGRRCHSEDLHHYLRL